MVSFTCKISFALLLLLSVMSFNGSICSGRSGIRCHESDRRLLQIFKEGVSDSFNLLPSWSTEQDCCAWEGVHCDNITARVTRLHLNNVCANCLRGEINLSLLQLEFLNYLNLSHNGFETVRYPSIQSQRYYNQSLATSSLLYANFSSSLIYLDFSSNYDLQMDNLHWLSLVPSLKYLNLGDVDLHNETNWLQSVAMLPSLSELRLSNCNLTNIHPSLKYVSFTSLITLDLSSNHFEYEASDWLLNLISSEISYFAFGANNLGQIPKSLLNLRNLKTLDLSSNKLNGSIPNWLGQLEHLQDLDLGGNELNGPIPNWLGQLEHLQDLDLSYNLLSGPIPLSLGNLSSLVTLDIGFNYLSGNLPQIPTSLLNFRNLKSLDFSYNKLNGSIPNWLGQLEHLQDLDLCYNFLSGPIPPSLGNLSTLVGLDVSFNRLSGNLPESLGQLSNLESLLVAGNPLTGILFEIHFEGLAKLKDLDLGYTSIAFDLGPNWVPPFQLHNLNLRSSNLGPNFPPWIYTQRSLESLDVSCTGISFIDNMFGNFAGGIKKELNMSYNSISGDISKILLNTESIFLSSNNFKGALPRISENVSILDVSHNSFTGSISSLLCHTVNARFNELAYLDLSSNLLTGELPDCWRNWEYLRMIFLGNNRLTGELPPSLGSLLFLEAIDLQNNSFSGEILSSLQNCKSLEFINFERNKLTGSIPTWISEGVMILQLRSNQFVGNIPLEVCQLSNLFVLDIAYNKLSGSIPRCLNNISTMVDYSDFKSWVVGFGDVSDPYRVMLQTKGHELEYRRNLKFFRTIDLSSNNLSGGIPSELFILIGLHTLNLSQNRLVGKIPKNIGDMKNLESLDLSNNQLSGEIPQSISNLNFLSVLNLSFNDFWGQIPLGNQLITFDAWSYIGNSQLCGPPLTKNCTKEKPVVEEHDESKTMSWFYLGMGIGFAAGFWGVCGAIFFNRTFRHAYFRLLDRIADRIYVSRAL